VALKVPCHATTLGRGGTNGTHPRRNRPIPPGRRLASCPAGRAAMASAMTDAMPGLTSMRPGRCASPGHGPLPCASRPRCRTPTHATSCCRVTDRLRRGYRVIPAGRVGGQPEWRPANAESPGAEWLIGKMESICRPCCRKVGLDTVRHAAGPHCPAAHLSPRGLRPGRAAAV
jgi:hypothetical protein